VPRGKISLVQQTYINAMIQLLAELSCDALGKRHSPALALV